ncbi:ABC transporter substrate-binding protein [Seohaeicola zhoushanensis]
MPCRPCHGGLCTDHHGGNRPWRGDPAGAAAVRHNARHGRARRHRSIGGTVAGIPAQTVSTYLSKYAETATPVGSPFEPDVEKIAALQPDLIIVAGRSAPKFDELSGIATVIDLTPDTTNVMPSIRRNAATLGAIYGKQEEAAAKVAALDEALAKVKAAASGRGTALTLLTTGARMSTHGDKGRFGLIYNEFGFPGHRGREARQSRPADQLRVHPRDQSRLDLRRRPRRRHRA